MQFTIYSYFVYFLLKAYDFFNGANTFALPLLVITGWLMFILQPLTMC